jgi:hypothetical protein
VLQLAREAEARSVVLYHHDPDRDDDQLDALQTSTTAWWQAQVGATSAYVAREGLDLELTSAGATVVL